MDSPYPTLVEALRMLKGSSIDSVNFIHDYLQICWTAGCLTIYNPAVLQVSGQLHSASDSESRDDFYSLEGQILDDVTKEAAALLISLQGGARLSISLADEDYIAPEALLYQETDGLLWVV